VDRRFFQSFPLFHRLRGSYRGWDYVIYLWNTTSDTYDQVLRDPDEPDIFFYGVAWSPDGQRLASGTYMHGVLVWDVPTRNFHWVGRAYPT